MVGRLGRGLITHAPHGHVLTNCRVWSADSKWIVYDTRSDAAGSCFDGTWIERVHVDSGRVERLYTSQHGACCGVVTYAPHSERVVFILGPENPTDGWRYSACHRQGVIVEVGTPGEARRLEARDLVPPFTCGALRGGTHVHIFSPDESMVSFTYEDHWLGEERPEGGELNQRNVGVAWMGRGVEVPAKHVRNHSGMAYAALVSRTHDHAEPGSDEIERAYEETWLEGSRGDGAGLVFLGDVRNEAGSLVTEVFGVEVPREVGEWGGEVCGTKFTRPRPPEGVVQRRLTRTGDRRYPGVCQPRHWPRSSPDGREIVVLMRDEHGVPQMVKVNVETGRVGELSRLECGVESAISWSGCGGYLVCVSGGHIWRVDARDGEAKDLTRGLEYPLRGEACVLSPDGRSVACVVRVGGRGGEWNQIMVVRVE